MMVIQVKALQNITDTKTGVLHMASDVFEFERPVHELQWLMHEGLIVILDPAVSPAIMIKEKIDGNFG